MIHQWINVQQSYEILMTSIHDYFQGMYIRPMEFSRDLTVNFNMNLSWLLALLQAKCETSIRSEKISIVVPHLRGGGGIAHFLYQYRNGWVYVHISVWGERLFNWIISKFRLYSRVADGWKVEDVRLPWKMKTKEEFQVLGWRKLSAIVDPGCTSLYLWISPPRFVLFVFQLRLPEVVPALLAVSLFCFFLLPYSIYRRVNFANNQIHFVEGN